MQLALILIIILSAIATFGLNWVETENAETKNWRLALYKRRIQRWFIYKAWQAYIPNLRWLVLLFIGLITYWLVRKYLPDFKISEIAKLNKVSDATVMLALIGAPIAYVIWWFRDANARQQIENQRKDVNLKDFQRLAEWAAGMHLPENKITTSEKEIKLKGKDTKSEVIENKTSTSTETLTSTESAVIPAGTVIHTPSRREGAASLQIAAIYQLQAFLQGDYGKYFQRPAFQLLKSIWLALVSQHLATLDTLMQQERNATNKIEKWDFDEKLASWKIQLANTMNSTIGQAITVALGAQQGWLLRTHQADLPNAILTGFNSHLAALHQPLELDGLNLRGIELQGAKLIEAKLQGAELYFAQLQGADLFLAELQGAFLSGAKLQGADLSNAKLQGAILRRAELQGADLSNAQLQGADLSYTKLQGTDIISAKLQGANLSNIRINEDTQFNYCEVDDETTILATRRLAYNNDIDITKTFELRAQLHKQGLNLPSWFNTQLHAKPTKYHFINKQDQKETRQDIGLLSSFN